MADPMRFIGRIGKLKSGTSSSPYVQVESYDSGLGEYLVKVSSRDRGEGRRVKPSDIDFQTTIPDFMNTFPNPPHFMIQGNLDMKNIPSKSVVDFTECTSDPVVDGKKLIIRGSYRFVGKRTMSEGGKVVLTRLPCSFVGAQNEGDIIEFENIWFDVGESNHNVVCLRGNIVFRNCVINGAEIGLKVGSGRTPVNVLFEGGAIFYKGGSGAVVDAHSQLTMVGVEIGRPSGLFGGVGANVKDGGVLTADYCTFTGNIFGLVMSGGTSTGKAELTNCTFQSNKKCRVLADGGKLTMSHCEVTSTAGCGVVVDHVGSMQPSVTMDSCRITNCGCGMRTSGVSAITCSSLSISDCTVGMYLTSTTTGLLSFFQPKYSNNGINFAHLGENSTVVTIDNIAQIYYNRKKRVQDLHNTLLALPEKVNELGRALSTVWSLRTLRIMTRCQLHLPLPSDNWQITKMRKCSRCAKPELSFEGARFKKCGRCRQVCYCSRDCQRDLWIQHQVECSLPNEWHRELWRMDCVSCTRCHTVVEKEFEDFSVFDKSTFCTPCTANHNDEVRLYRRASTS